MDQNVGCGGGVVVNFLFLFFVSIVGVFSWDRDMNVCQNFIVIMCGEIGCFIEILCGNGMSVVRIVEFVCGVQVLYQVWYVIVWVIVCDVVVDGVVILYLWISNLKCCFVQDWQCRFQIVIGD